MGRRPAAFASQAWRPLALVAAVVAALLLLALSAPLLGPKGSPPVEITILEWQERRSQATARALPEFERRMAAAGRPVRVRAIDKALSDEAFRRDISDEYREGRAPDLTSYPTAWVPDFAAEGHTRDLSEYVAAWPDWSSHFYPVLRDRATLEDGHIYGVPRGATVIQLFYRRDVLEDLGVSTEQPATWDDLVDRMVDLRRRMGQPPILIPAGTSWGGGTFDEGFINLLLGTESELYDETTERWIIRSPGIESVLRLYERLTAAKLLPVDALLGPRPWEPTKYRTFPDGDLAVTVQGTWGWTYDWGRGGRAPIPDLTERVGTWRFPTEKPSMPFVWAAESWAWTISTQSEHPAEAFELVKFLSAGEPLAADLAAVGNLAPRDDIATVQPYAEFEALIADERLLAVGRSFEARPGIELVQDAVGTVTEGLITGRLDATEAADELERMLRESLGDERVMVDEG